MKECKNRTSPGTAIYNENCLRDFKKGLQEKQSKKEPIHVEQDGNDALRYDDGKLPIHLIPPEVIFALAKVFQYGAKKYAPRNWEKGMPWSKVYDSGQRHSLTFWNGQDIDEESGLPHVFHWMWNAAALVVYRETCPEKDDRPCRVKRTQGDEIQPEGKVS